MCHTLGQDGDWNMVLPDVVCSLKLPGLSIILITLHYLGQLLLVEIFELLCDWPSAPTPKQSFSVTGTCREFSSISGVDGSLAWPVRL